MRLAIGKRDMWMMRANQGKPGEKDNGLQSRMRCMLHRNFHIIAYSGDALGKPAGVRCVHLTGDYLCGIFGTPERPAVCMALRPSAEMCGAMHEEAYRYLKWLEVETRPC